MDDGSHDIPDLTDAQWDRLTLMWAFLSEEEGPEDESEESFRARFAAWRERIRAGRN